MRSTLDFAVLSNPCYHYNMTSAKERILVVENNTLYADILARQTLQPMGYQVDIVQAAGPAIEFALQNNPDLILTSLQLPGISGKDLLVALSSQKIGAPVIVIADKDVEWNILQAFRLGAVDFLHHPLREAEVLSAVERALTQVKGKRERELLARQLQQTNEELQQRIRELTTIFAIGKAVTSITDQRLLLEKLVEAAVFITDGDLGWILLRGTKSEKSFILSASRNLPQRLERRQGRLWDDGMSSLVAISRAPLSIHGEPLKRFPVHVLGGSALVVPIKAKREVLGMMVVMRKADHPFSGENQVLLESVADYASISLVNANLFKHLSDQALLLKRSAESAQIGEQIKNDLFRQIGREIQKPLEGSLDQLMTLMGNYTGTLTTSQNEVLRNASEQLGYLIGIADALDEYQELMYKPKREGYDLNISVRAVLTRFQAFAIQRGITLHPDLSPTPLFVCGNPAHFNRILEGLLSNALKFSPGGASIKVNSEQAEEMGRYWAYIKISDRGTGMTQEQVSHLFETGAKCTHTPAIGYGGLGIRLPLAKNVAAIYGGELWIDSELDRGTTAHLMLPSDLIH
jgi:signal transduction histidine kinase/DNA-binding response OmpR family regulator